MRQRLGKRSTGLARVAKVSKAEGRATRNITRCSSVLGRGELLPYASYYLTGFLNEKPLANLRATWRRWA